MELCAPPAPGGIRDHFDRAGRAAGEHTEPPPATRRSRRCGAGTPASAQATGEEVAVVDHLDRVVPGRGRSGAWRTEPPAKIACRLHAGADPEHGAVEGPDLVAEALERRRVVRRPGACEPLRTTASAPVRSDASSRSAAVRAASATRRRASSYRSIAAGVRRDECSVTTSSTVIRRNDSERGGRRRARPPRSSCFFRLAVNPYAEKKLLATSSRVLRRVAVFDWCSEAPRRCCSAHRLSPCLSRRRSRSSTT